jgi:STE24 endopeptidase
MRHLAATLAFLLVATLAHAQGTPLAPTVAATISAVDTSIVPVPVPSAQAEEFYSSGFILWFVENGWSAVVPLLILFTGLSAKMRTLAERLGRGRIRTVMIYMLFFAVVSFLFDLPLSFYAEFIREHSYGLSNQSFGKWIGDAGKNLLIGAISAALIGWIPYSLIRRSPRRWWLYFGIGSVPVIFFFILIKPVFIDPMFNDFGRMEDKALESTILTLAHRAGIDADRVYEVKKSEDTKRLNAYVTGFWNTKRIVLWDNTIKRLDEQELMFVMSHEIGHFVLGHIWRSVIVIGFITILGLFVIHRTMGWALGRWGERIGAHDITDVAALPLAMLIIFLYGMAVNPAINWMSRYHEHQSDQFGLELTQNNHAAATAFVKLQTDNLSIPYPGELSVFLRSSHPPLGDRITFANSYKPWKTGGVLEFGERFGR